MSRATNDAFDALHALTVEAQTEELRRNMERARLPKRIPDPEDEKKTIANPEYEPLNTRLLQTVIKLLADNGIDTPAQAKRFDGLLDQLKDLPLDDPHTLAN